MIVLRHARYLAYAPEDGELTMVATQPLATLRYAAVSSSTRWLAREAGPPTPPKPRLLDRVRAALRARHFSRRTEEAYVAWIRRYIFFHGKRHPAEMGAPEVTRFPLSALLFLYREVLGLGLPWLGLPSPAGFAMLYRPAYPAAEF